MSAKQAFIVHLDTMMLDRERDALLDIIARKQLFPLNPAHLEHSATQLGFLLSATATHAQLGWFAQVLL